MRGSGAESAAGVGAAALVAAVSDLVSAAAAALLGVVAGPDFVHAVVVSGSASKTTNHRGHKEARSKDLPADFLVMPGSIVIPESFVLLSVLCGQLFFFSARFFRWVGCTIQAIPMLRTYKASIGAAKMHMLTTSGVGVMMPAMMKMPSIP